MKKSAKKTVLSNIRTASFTPEEWDKHLVAVLEKAGGALLPKDLTVNMISGAGFSVNKHLNHPNQCWTVRDAVERTLKAGVIEKVPYGRKRRYIFHLVGKPLPESITSSVGKDPKEKMVQHGQRGERRGKSVAKKVVRSRKLKSGSLDGFPALLSAVGKAISVIASAVAPIREIPKMMAEIQAEISELKLDGAKRVEAAAALEARMSDLESMLREFSSGSSEFKKLETDILEAIERAGA